MSLVIMTRQILLLAALVAVCVTAGATPLSIVNPSFEALSLGEGGFTFSAPGWTTSGDSGTFNPAPSNYLDPTPDGDNVAFSSIGGPWVSQTLTDTLLGESTYRLTLQVGRRMGVSTWPGHTIELRAGGVVLTSIDTLIGPAEGRFEAAVLEYTSSATDPQIGQPLEIAFRSGGFQANFDDVRLELNPIPEPASLMATLVALGAIAAGRRR